MSCSPSPFPRQLLHHHHHHHHHHNRPPLRRHLHLEFGIQRSSRGWRRVKLLIDGGSRECVGPSPFLPTPSSGLFPMPPSSAPSSGCNTVWSGLNCKLHNMNRVEGSPAASKDVRMFEHEPDHLLVLVHGIMSSTSDWTYASAVLKTRLGNNYLIYASSSNTYTKTFDGIDGAGKRLADEVLSVIQRTQSLKKISFLAHSLGGLFARYAIALLYSLDTLKVRNLEGTNDLNSRESTLCTIGGLEPISFITLATPHLGVRGKKQLPFLLGVHILEKLAPPVAPILVGRTGRQLFLTDDRPNKPPLLLRMATDCEDLKFISSLAAFRNRVAYANVSYDHMVGWRTSSIRREAELNKPCQRSLKGYKHVVDVEYCPPVLAEAPHFATEAAKGKEAAQEASDLQNIADYYKLMEEEMIRGLQRVGWKKVDVSFHSAIWPFFAHNNMHVKKKWLHIAGAGVIAHVADTLKQQDSQTFIAANL